VRTDPYRVRVDEDAGIGVGAGAEATPLLRQEKFTALFFSLRMPSPDGVELTRQARSPGLNQFS
jgi:CheY-like chemotaxis protein